MEISQVSRYHSPNPLSTDLEIERESKDLEHQAISNIEITNSHLQLYIYPIKGLRPVSLPKTTLTPYGFPYDRHFMLHKIFPDDGSSGKNKKKTITVSSFPITTRFLTDIVFPEDDPNNGGRGRIIVTYHPPPDSGDEQRVRKLEVPLQPEVEDLDVVDIDLHESPTKAYDMGAKYNAWFSDCFGFDVEFAYLGPSNTRRVLGNVNVNTTDATPAAAADQQKSDGGGGWLSALSNSISYISGTSQPASQGEAIETGITFADLASYLVVSETSCDDVSTRLPDGEKMDITKFRPNIVVKGAQTAFEEDFWAEIKIGEDDVNAKVALTANCPRCTSLNVDYGTGAFGTGESGKVLKKLMKDRRIDVGGKYSPVFGRYGFLGNSGNKDPSIAVGDKVEVTKKNDEHTKLCKFLGLSDASNV